MKRESARTSSGRPRLKGLKPGEWKCFAAHPRKGSPFLDECDWVGVPARDKDGGPVCAKCGSEDIFDDEPEDQPAPPTEVGW